MSNYAGGLSSDPEVNRMRAARERSVVLKTKLVSFRSLDPLTFIFVFEGPDDPIVYRQWINRIDDKLNYASMTCSGKAALLEFMTMMERDADGAGDRVLYFIDADFDGDRGYKSEKLFMTDMYSVENYLVNERVVDETLKNEFSCSLEPDVRRLVITDFAECYELFLAQTSLLNARIFAARKLRIELKKALPVRLSGIAVVDYKSVGDGKIAAEDLIVLEREPSEEEWTEINLAFQSLHARTRYRGKFAMLFFIKWLEALHREYLQEKSPVFQGIVRSHKPRMSEIGLGNFASKSSMPDGLAEFLRQAA